MQLRAAERRHDGRSSGGDVTPYSAIFCPQVICNQYFAATTVTLSRLTSFESRFYFIRSQKINRDSGSLYSGVRLQLNVSSNRLGIRAASRTETAMPCDLAMLNSPVEEIMTKLALSAAQPARLTPPSRPCYRRMFALCFPARSASGKPDCPLIRPARGHFIATEL